MADYSRRRFIRSCSATALWLTVSANGMPKSTEPLSPFARVLLVDEDGRPVDCKGLPAGREYVFFYPYASTPCFLLNLGQPVSSSVSLTTQDGQPYEWQGGVGPQHSVVAFSAICSHKLTHPSAAVSFIGFREEAVGYLNDNGEITRRARVIQCCSEQSIYDPAQGAKVLSGPAPQPLAAIALSDEKDRLYATGVYGGTLFKQFFERFGFRLALEFGEERVQERVVDSTVVTPIESHTQRRIQC